MSGIPKVILTPRSEVTGVIAGKTRNVTKSGFDGTIGGSSIASAVFDYIAIY
jgi:hypothetical protein